MKRLIDSFKYRPANIVKEGSSKVFDPSFAVGIEVEVENAGANHRDTTAWEPHNDGSLRNGGIEYTSMPLSGGAIDKYVTAFWNGMPVSWTFSQRTSIHVHVNIQDFTYEELTRLLLVYCACEPIMFDFVGGDRDKSIFCTPLLETVYPEELIHKILAADARTVQGWDKYSAVNLSRAPDLGTIEFRHMVGTRDLNKIMMWLKIIQCLYLYARKNDLKVIRKLMEKADEHTLLAEFFTPEIRAVFATKETRRLFKRGIASVITAMAGHDVTTQLVKGRSAKSVFSEFKGTA